MNLKTFAAALARRTPTLTSAASFSCKDAGTARRLNLLRSARHRFHAFTALLAAQLGQSVAPSDRDRELFERLSRSHPTPLRVQKLLRSLPYNREARGETLRSALGAWKQGTAHCLEATFIAAAILEHRGHPPLVLSLESKDDLDHVLFIFKSDGRWGSIGRSRDEGLHGRPPRFRSVRELVWSYFDPYVDKTGRITGYGTAHLDSGGGNWRDSTRNVWSIEQFLIDLPHTKLRSSDERYRRLLAGYHARGPLPRKGGWW